MSYLSWTAAASRSLCISFPAGISQASISPLHLFVKQRKKISLMKKRKGVGGGRRGKKREERRQSIEKAKSFRRIINFLDTIQQNAIVPVSMC